MRLAPLEWHTSCSMARMQNRFERFFRRKIAEVWNGPFSILGIISIISHLCVVNYLLLFIHTDFAIRITHFNYCILRRFSRWCFDLSRARTRVTATHETAAYIRYIGRGLWVGRALCGANKKMCLFVIQLWKIDMWNASLFCILLLYSILFFFFHSFILVQTMRSRTSGSYSIRLIEKYNYYYYCCCSFLLHRKHIDSMIVMAN